VAGHDSTANTMTLITEALSRHPEAWAYMRAHPEDMPNCINELMRYVAMASGQPRLVAEDFEWHGQRLKKGEPVALLIAGANRDPRVFKDPEKLDFSRDNSASQVFAPGIHHCIGHLLAKMQLIEFFTALVERFDSVEVLDEKLDFMPAFVFRGMYGMNVRFHPRKA
jgi:pimeloyl-[acyl-carrier protein] synthase